MTETEQALRASIKLLNTRIDIVLMLHKPDPGFNCAECGKYATFKVPYPCKTAISLGEV